MLTDDAEKFTSEMHDPYTRGRRIYQGVYPWERIAVFQARLVKVREVNAHSPLSTILSHHDHIC